MIGSTAITSLGAWCRGASTETPRTLAEWERMYRQLRRRQCGTEQAFQKRTRVLFKVSGFVRLKGWKREDLEAELTAVQDEPVPDPPAKKLKPRDTRPARPTLPKLGSENSPGSAVPESPEEILRRDRIRVARSVLGGQSVARTCPSPGAVWPP